MKVRFIEKLGSWRGVADAARTTINMDAGDKEPSSTWKRKMIMCEHSPIRKMIYSWKWTDLPSWVSVHLVRHKTGAEHFVGTQRSDRTGLNRDETPQGAFVVHEEFDNAQTIINTSRKRLCMQASPETREAWILFLDEVVKPNDPELYIGCVPECVYRNGLCPEYRTCGFNKTVGFEKQLKVYISGFENQINDKTLIK